jgi:hypothetical protein
MRKLAVLLILLATAKVATLQWLHRSAADDVIIAAYRPRALDACAGDARRLQPAVAGQVWGPDTAVRLEIGRRLRDVYVWQVDNPAWSERYRNPYLHLQPAGPEPRLRCEYDIVNGTAAVSRL